MADCPGVDTPAPPQEQVCPGLQCGHLPSLAERVKCRLQLTPEQLSAEFQVLYFPEYCKAEETPEEQQACIALYRAFGTCWQMPFGKERLSCGKRTVGIQRTIAREQFQCKKKKPKAAKRACLEELNEKIENYTLFQMYEYEVQAEGFLKHGKASLDAVADFDTFVELKKQEVDKTESRKEWRKLLKAVRTRFKEFFSK